MIFVWLAALVLIVPAKLWAMLHLLHGYRPHEYVATARARRLYGVHLATSLALPVPLVGAAFLSGLWWVEAPAVAAFAFVAVKVGWVIHMRRTGKHLEYYRRHHYQ